MNGKHSKMAEPGSPKRLGELRSNRQSPLEALWLLCFSISFLLLPTLASAQISSPPAFTTIASISQDCYVEADTTVSSSGKIPLLLIHGIDLKSQPASISDAGWNNFLIYFYNNPALTSQYKIYRYAYRSNQVPVSQLGTNLVTLLNYVNNDTGFDQQFPNQNFLKRT